MKPPLLVVGDLADDLRREEFAVLLDAHDSALLEQLKEAILAYSTAVANKPEHWDAQCNLAAALHLRGDLDNERTREK